MNNQPPSGSRRAKMPVMHGGTTLLLAVLLVLVLCVLALLTYSSARSDYALAQKMAHKQALYYEACSRAEEILQKVDTAILSAQGDAPDFSGMDVEVRGDIVSWEVPVSAEQILAAEVSLSSRRILRWQLISSGEWAGNDHHFITQP